MAEGYPSATGASTGGGMHKWHSRSAVLVGSHLGQVERHHLVGRACSPAGQLGVSSRGAQCEQQGGAQYEQQRGAQWRGARRPARRLWRAFLGGGAGRAGMPRRQASQVGASRTRNVGWGEETSAQLGCRGVRV